MASKLPYSSLVRTTVVYYGTFYNIAISAATIVDSARTPLPYNKRLTKEERGRALSYADSYCTQYYYGRAAGLSAHCCITYYKI